MTDHCVDVGPEYQIPDALWERVWLWKALPRSLGAPSTVHDRFQEWREAGIFERMWQAGLPAYDEQIGIEWEWQAMDGAMTKAPLGKKEPVPIPLIAPSPARSVAS